LRFVAEQDKIGSPLPLEAGDLIHVIDSYNSDTYEGVIEVTAPHLNVIWVRTTGGDRKLVDANECTIQRVG
jgi:hypothetical protein